MGQFWKIMKESSGAPMREWASTIPNDGLIRYLHAMNAERVMITSPKALGEVLVTKNYEFIKPSTFRHGLGQLLGIGILLAEGDEHKVSLLKKQLLCSQLISITFNRDNGNFLCQLFHFATSRVCIQHFGPRLVK